MTGIVSRPIWAARSLLLLCLAPDAQHLLGVRSVTVKNLLESIEELSNCLGLWICAHGFNAEPLIII